jgi:hypothetical protein
MLLFRKTTQPNIPFLILQMIRAVVVVIISIAESFTKRAF